MLPSFAWAVAAFGASACQTSPPKPRPQQSKGSERPSVPDEASLKEDRSSLDNLRSQEPEEIKRQNDELALLLDVMKDGAEEPSRVRDRYNKIVRDKRDKMDKRLRKERDAYEKQETKAREEFTKSLQRDRARFVARKRSLEKSKEFFDDQETKRKAFYEDQREKRGDFETTAQNQRRDFEDYAREKTNWFNQEMRGYSTAYYERQNALSKKKEMAEKAKRLSPKSAPEYGAPPSDAGPVRIESGTTAEPAP